MNIRTYTPQEHKEMHEKSPYGKPVIAPLVDLFNINIIKKAKVDLRLNKEFGWVLDILIYDGEGCTQFNSSCGVQRIDGANFDSDNLYPNGKLNLIAEIIKYKNWVKIVEGNHNKSQNTLEWVSKYLGVNVEQIQEISFIVGNTELDIPI